VRRFRIAAVTMFALTLVAVGYYVVTQANTKAQPGSSTTRAAAQIDNTSALVRGSVVTGGIAATYVFEYGTTLDFGSVSAPQRVAEGPDSIRVSENLKGLRPGTTYFYRLVVTNRVGRVNGRVASFVTTSPPLVSTVRAARVTSTSARLIGKVNPKSARTVFLFEYGQEEFSRRTAVDNAGTYAAMSTVRLPVTGLAPATTYKFRIVATNDNGISRGKTLDFTTPAN
jgi:phosphodiesterase/alkaline phosphatase D-like protein